MGTGRAHARHSHYTYPREAAMKPRTRKTTKKPKLSAVERAVEEVRAVRRQLWKDAGGTFEGVIAIGRREGSLPPAPATRRKRRSA